MSKQELIDYALKMKELAFEAKMSGDQLIHIGANEKLNGMIIASELLLSETEYSEFLYAIGYSLVRSDEEKNFGDVSNF